MLFLSVVMMLPISTISQGTQQVTASSTVPFMGCGITTAFDDVISLMPLFYLVALLFISSFVIFLAQNLKKNTSAFVEPSNAHGSFSIFYNALRKIDLNNYVAKLYTKFNRDTYWSTLQDNMRLGALRAKEYLVNFDVLNKNKLLFNAIN